MTLLEHENCQKCGRPAERIEVSIRDEKKTEWTPQPAFLPHILERKRVTSIIPFFAEDKEVSGPRELWLR